MIYYKNSPVERSAGMYLRSEIRILSADEVNQLVSERKITPITEITYSRNCSRISRPRNWVNYDR